MVKGANNETVSAAMPQVANLKMPQVALQNVASEEVTVSQSATESRRQSATSGKKTGRKPATRGKQQVDRDPAVEVVQTSKGTYLFRFRFNSLQGRPAQSVVWVTEPVYQRITSDPEMYSQYKAQLIAHWRQSNEI